MAYITQEAANILARADEIQAADKQAKEHYTKSLTEAKLQRLQDAQLEKVARLGELKTGLGLLGMDDGTSVINGKTYMNKNKLYNDFNAAAKQELLSKFAAEDQWILGSDGQLRDLQGNIQDPRNAGIWYSGRTSDGNTKMGYVSPYGTVTNAVQEVADNYKHFKTQDKINPTLDPYMVAMYGPKNKVLELEAILHGNTEALGNRAWDLGSKDPNRPTTRYTEVYKGTDVTNYLGDTSTNIPSNMPKLLPLPQITFDTVEQINTQNTISGYNVRGGNKGDYATSPKFAEVMTKKVHSLGGEGALNTPQKIYDTIMATGKGSMTSKEVVNLANTVYKETAKTGMDPTLLIASMMIETGNFTSNVFKNNRNLGGVTWNEGMRNIPGMSKGTARPASEGGYYVKFSNPEEAIKRQVQAWEKQRVNKVAPDGFWNSLGRGIPAAASYATKSVWDFADTAVELGGNLAARGAEILGASKDTVKWLDSADLGTAEAKTKYTNALYGYDNAYSAETMKSVEDNIDKAFEKVDLFDPSTYSNIQGGAIVDAFMDATSSPETTLASLGYLIPYMFGGWTKAGMKTLSAKGATTATKIAEVAKNTSLTNTAKTAQINALKAEMSIADRAKMVIANNAGAIAMGANMTNDQLDTVIEKNGGEMPTLWKVGSAFVINTAGAKLDMKVASDITTGKPIMSKLAEALGAVGQKTATRIVSKAGEYGVKLITAGFEEMGQEFIQSYGEAFNKTYGTKVMTDFEGGTKEISALEAAIHPDVRKEAMTSAIAGAAGGVHMNAPSTIFKFGKDVLKGSKQSAAPTTLTTPSEPVKTMTDKEVRTRTEQLITQMETTGVTSEHIAEIDKMHEELVEGETKTKMKAFADNARKLYTDKIVADTDDTKTLGSRNELMYMLDDIGETNLTTVADDKVYMLASRSGLLGKGDEESKKVAYKQIKKDWATVKTDSESGKRGSLTYVRNLDSLLNAVVPDKVAIKKQIEKLNRYESTQTKYVKNMHTKVAEINTEIATVNAQITSKKPFAETAKNKLIEKYKNKSIQIVEAQPTSKFVFNIKENGKGLLELTSAEGIKNILEAKETNAKFMSTSLQSMAKRLEKIGLTTEETGVSDKPIVDETNLKKFGDAAKKTIERIAKSTEWAEKNGGTIKLATIINKEGFTEALTKDSMSITNQTEGYTDKDVLYVVLDNAKSEEDVKAVYKSIQKGGALYKVLKAARQAGATIVLDKGLRQVHYKDGKIDKSRPTYKTKVALYKTKDGKVHTKEKSVFDLLKSSFGYSLPNENIEPLTLDELKARVKQAKEEDKLTSTKYKAIRTSEGGTDSRMIFKPAAVVDANRVKTKEEVKAKGIKEAIVQKHYMDWANDVKLTPENKIKLLDNLDNKDGLSDVDLIKKVFEGRFKSRVAKVKIILDGISKLTDTDQKIAKADALDNLKMLYTTKEIAAAEQIREKLSKSGGTITGYVTKMKEYLKSLEGDRVFKETEIAERKETLLTELLEELGLERQNIPQNILDGSISKGVNPLYFGRFVNKETGKVDWGITQTKGAAAYKSKNENPNTNYRKYVNDLTAFIKAKKTPDTLLTTVPVDVLLGDKIDYIDVMIKWLTDTQKVRSNDSIEGKLYTERMLDLKTSPALGLIFDKDGKVNRTVAFAMQLAGDEYLKINSNRIHPEFKSKEEVARVFGVLETSVTKAMIALVRDQGTHNKSISNDIGKSVLSKLGLSFDPENTNDAEKELFNKVTVDIGQMVVLSMINNGVLQDSRTSEKEKGKLTSKITIDKYAKALDQKAPKNLLTGDRNVWFIKLADLKKGVTMKETIDKLTKDYVEIVELIDDKNTYEKKYSTREIDIATSRHVREKVSKDILGIEIPTGKLKDGKGYSPKEFIEKLINTKWKVDTDNVDTLLNMHNNEKTRSVILDYLGYVTDEQLAKMTLEGRAAAEAQNRDTLNSIDELQKMVDSGDYKKEGIWFDWFYTVNGRYMMDSNTINPQTNKLHRFLVQPASHNKTYKKTANGVEIIGAKIDGETATMLLDYALAQAFGYKVDKKNTASVRRIGAALRGLTKAQLTQLKKEFAAGGHLSDKYRVNEKWYLPGTKFTTKNGVKIAPKDAITLEVDHLSHTIQALDILTKLSETKNGNTFTSSITAEFDAVTSGFGLKLLQLPILDDMWTWLVKVGIFNEDSLKALLKNGELSMNDILSEGLLDSYQTLSSSVKLTAADVKDRLNNTQYALWEVLEESGLIQRAKDGEAISSALRALFKDPFMTFNYAASIKKIKQNLAQNLTDELLEGVAQENPKYQKITIELATATGLKPAELVKKLREDPTSKIKMQVGDKKSNIEEYLVDMYVKTYGAEVEQIMKDKFEKFMIANDTINGAFRIMFDVFKDEYTKAKAKVLSGRWSSAEFQKIMYGENGVPGLIERFPIIRGPLSKDGSIREGIGIYKIGTQAPTDDTVRYTPAQTTTGIKDGDVTRTVMHLIAEFEAAINSGSVIPIHYLDGASLAQLAGYDITTMHDAIMPELDKSLEAIKTYNEGILVLAQQYRLIDAIVEMIDKIKDVDIDKVSKTSLGIWTKTKEGQVKVYTNTKTEDPTVKIIPNSQIIKNLKQLQKEVKTGWDKIEKQIIAIGHMVGVPGSMWVDPKVESAVNNLVKKEQGFGAGDIYSQTEYGVTAEELKEIDKANKKFMAANKQIEVVMGNTFNYNNNVIILDRDANEADTIVYMAHEIVHAKTVEWLANPANKALANKLEKAIDGVLNKLNTISIKNSTEEQVVLTARLTWASGGDKAARTVENVAVLAAEPAMRRELLKLLPEQERSLIDRILDKIKEWFGKELPMDGQRILKLVDKIVVKAEKGSKVATISNKKEVADEIMVKLTALMAGKKMEPVQAIINKIKDC